MDKMLMIKVSIRETTAQGIELRTAITPHEFYIPVTAITSLRATGRNNEFEVKIKPDYAATFG